MVIVYLTAVKIHKDASASVEKSNFNFPPLQQRAEILLEIIMKTVTRRENTVPLKKESGIYQRRG